MDLEVSQLLQSRSTYEALVNTLPLSLLIKDADGRRLFANKAYLDVREATLQDLVGKRDEDLFPPDIAKQYRQDDLTVMRSGRSLHSVEETSDRAGRRSWIERIKSPIFDDAGQVIGIQVMFWDVSDRIKAERALQREKDLLGTLLKHIPDSIYFKDRDSRFIRISEAMAAKFGLANAQVAVGLTDADIFTDQHAEQARTDELRIMQTRQPLINREERETWPDHEDTWCLSTKMPMAGEHDEVIGTFGISRDITELKRSRDALQKAVESADRANRAKSDFLANMSHEIRTPMNAIIGMSQLLSQTELNQQQTDYVEMVRESADSLLRLLNDILDFSKIEARKLELESIPFSIRDLSKKVVRLLSVRASEKGLNVQCRVDDDVPDCVAGDPGRLRQILINLVGNAIKFTDEGDVTISVARSTGEPNDDALSTDEYAWLHFRVRDTGIGIASDQQAAVLEAFTQADTSTTRRFGGTGLGLAITKQLIALMGGQLQLESRVGEGATFFFDARFATSDSDAVLQEIESEDSSAAAIPCPPLRVLVAEDGLANQHVAVGMLQAAGHQAIVASDGRETIARWQNEAFDVILMDMHMPVMDGIEATKQIRAAEKKAGRRIPIIAVTAAAMKEDAKACLDAGMDAHLAKPIHPRRLQEMLAKYAPDETAASKSAAPKSTDFRSETTTLSGSQRLAQRWSPPEGADGGSIDLRAAAARVPGGLQGVRRLSEVFIPECESILDTLAREVPEGDASLIQRSAHTLKGSADLFYAKKVSELASRLEMQARRGEFSEARAIFEELQKESRLMLRELHSFLELTE